MNSITCKQCGHQLDEAATSCPNCGAEVLLIPPDCDYQHDSQDNHLKQLLDTARHYQQDGDLTMALQYAREALRLQNDCSTTHALLGYLYEQQGDQTAAQYHFQSALHITHQSPDTVTPHPHIRARQQPAGVMLIVLVGCVLFSGLAALFSFRPESHQTVPGAILHVPDKQSPLTATPPWTWQVPTPMTMKDVDLTESQKNGHSEEHTSQSVDQLPPSVPAPPADLAMGDADPAQHEVLGPSAHTFVLAGSNKPSLEAADQAYFRGEYDRAVMMYEAILAHETQPNPQLNQDLAWCYQQLGNSQKAAEHLEQAIQGYRAILDVTPGDKATQQALDTCAAALQTLLTSRNRDTAPAH